MFNLNKFFLSGNATKKPELKTNKNGKDFCSVGIAVNSSKEEVNFFNVLFYGKSAEILSQYVDKGSKLILEGNMARNEDGIILFGSDFSFSGSSKPKEDNEVKQEQEQEEIPF